MKQFFRSLRSTWLIEKYCWQESAFFIQRNRRYLVTLLALYIYSLSGWRRLRILRVGHCLAQHIDDVLDGDRRVDKPPLVYVDELLRQIQSGDYNMSEPIPVLAQYVFSEASPAMRDEFLALIEILCFDRVRRDARQILGRDELAEHHRRTFTHSMNIALMMVGSPIRANDVPEMVTALSWVSPMRDLRVDYMDGLINIPREVLEQVQYADLAGAEYDYLASTTAVQDWIQFEYIQVCNCLAALPVRLKSMWNLRGALEIFAFYLEIRRYSVRYGQLRQNSLSPVYKI